jgi:putative intracellular protease/amidase
MPKGRPDSDHHRTDSDYPFCVSDTTSRLRFRTIESAFSDWGVHVVSDGLLITGQNPASSGPAAKVLLDRLAKPVSAERNR